MGRPFSSTTDSRSEFIVSFPSSSLWTSTDWEMILFPFLSRGHTMIFPFSSSTYAIPVSESSIQIRFPQSSSPYRVPLASSYSVRSYSKSKYHSDTSGFFSSVISQMSFVWTSCPVIRISVSVPVSLAEIPRTESNILRFTVTPLYSCSLVFSTWSPWYIVSVAFPTYVLYRIPFPVKVPSS